MARKMAVRNKVKSDGKNNKSLDVKLSLNDTHGNVNKFIFFVLILLTLSIVVISFNFGKGYLYKRWPVTDVSINRGLNQVDVKSIAKLLKKSDYSYLLKVDLDALQKDIKKIDWVKNVEIRKKWPETLEVIVKEYDPIVIINEQVLIENGERLTPFNKKVIEGLPVIKMATENNYFNQDYVELAKQYLKVKGDFYKSELSISFLDIDKTNAWTLIAVGDIEIKLGRHKHTDRIARLNNLIPFLENINKVKTIDLRYSNGAAIRLKDDELNTNKLVG